MTKLHSAAFRILTFFAHPDDETMFLGGTLAYLAEQGVEVHYLCATRGEGGEMGDPPICARGDLGKEREMELRCAVEALGGKSVHFLDYLDPLVGPEGELYAFSDDIDPVADDIKEHISRVDPNIILTHGPGGEYGHPAHIQAHQAMMAALEGMKNSVEAVYSPAWLSRDTGRFTPEPGFVVDVSPWRAMKVNAVECHRSQHGLFLRHGSARAGRQVTIPEMVRGKEALCRLEPAREIAGEDQLGLLLGQIAIPADIEPH